MQPPDWDGRALEAFVRNRGGQATDNAPEAGQ